MFINKIDVNNRFEFRTWLIENGQNEKECWIKIKRGKPIDSHCFYYLDAVEEALCFGWIDSVWKNVDGEMWSKFTPRKPNSLWTELNKERVRRLERLGLMTEAGRKVLPNMSKQSFKIDPDIVKSLKEARLWSRFSRFPPLYQRIRAYNIAFYKTKDPKQYRISLNHLLEATKNNEMFGEWNDYGRLLND